MADPADDIRALYERHSQAWDRLRGRTLFERTWIDRFVALIPQGGSILDLGCGSGEPIAQYFIRSGFQVTGLDSSPSLIDLAQSRFPNQRWMVADMRATDFGEAFDGIVAWDSFFHLTADDQRHMFGVFASHAKTGTALLFTSGPHAGIAMGEFEGDPLYHASLDETEYRQLLADHGFHVVHHVKNDPDCGGHTVWLAQRA